MICSGCFREVPDLVGPHSDVCPECYGVAAEDLIPSLLSAEPVGGGAALWEEFAEDLEAYLACWESLEAIDQLESLEAPDCAPGFPIFGGRPRF
jgi:hypothetical protein